MNSFFINQYSLYLTQKNLKTWTYVIILGNYYFQRMYFGNLKKDHMQLGEGVHQKKYNSV